MSMISRIKQLWPQLRKNPWLLAILIITTTIVIANFKPGLYLVGWDNYSSYFNQSTNLFRTFFSTWREYRGLGTPSDSESVDVFRQIFYLLISPLVHESALDQIYILTCLFVGVLGMYFFSRKLFISTFGNIKPHQLDFISAVASFFYLFNLGTLAVFYFPMIMYINRFAALPVLFYTFYFLIINSKIKLKHIALASFAVLMTTVSYLTATVFITFLIFLPVFFVWLGNFKKQILTYALLIGLNLFWLLPFANYTLNNARSVKVAPTFIDANEILMNKPSSFYRLDKLLMLYPNFFDDTVTDVSKREKHPYHPDVRLFNGIFGKPVLLVFPVLYLLGSLLIILKYRKRNLLWVPVFICIALLFTGKSYSPFGFIYDLLDRLTPYIGILFRFADTKFNAFISFAGSISTAVVAYYAISHKWFEKKYTVMVLTVPAILTLLLFAAYFRGNLLGFFMYNKIPQAYFDIANIVNHDTSDFRILHLPLGRSGYWKPYVWGMNGSSFLHFMFDKPLIDRTFEPASSENTLLHKTILDLASNSQQISSEQNLRSRATELYSLLQKTGVKYIILDKTVNPNAYSKGVTFAGDFNYFDDETLIEAMKQNNQARTVRTYEINILDYLSVYPKQFPLSQRVIDDLKENPVYPIELIEVLGVNEKIYALTTAQKLDFDQENVLHSSVAKNGKSYIQQENAPVTVMYPFHRSNTDLVETKDRYQFELDNQFKKNERYIVQYPDDQLQNERSIVQVYARTDQNDLILSFQRFVTPYIQNQAVYQSLGEIKFPLKNIAPYMDSISSNARAYFSNWHILDQASYGNLRVSINNQVIPLPQRLNIDSQQVATLLHSGSDITVELLAPTDQKPLDYNAFQLTENPNCFDDKITDYDYSFRNTDELLLTSQNGSICIWSNLAQYLTKDTAHIELELQMSAKSADLDNEYIGQFESSSKPMLNEYISGLEKPNLLRICIQGTSYGDCLNQHQILSLQSNQTVTIPLEKTSKGITSPFVALGLKNITYQKQQIKFKSVILKPYNAILTEYIQIPKIPNDIAITIDPNKALTISVPKTLSLESFYFDKSKDGFELSNGPCDPNTNSYRTFKTNNSQLISYFQNCTNSISIYNRYSSNHFYLWKVDYHLFSGKYPRYSFGDTFNTYADEYLSLDQGYPDIPYFKDLQKPESFVCLLNPKSCRNKIQTAFSDTSFRTAYKYIYPQPELGSQTNQLYSLQQHSENEGVLSVRFFDIAELPPSWHRMTIQTTQPDTNYALPQALTYDQILPSLWKVTIQKQKNDSPVLLVFNESYNTQWGLYESVGDMLIGRTAGAKHVKFDGYANSWEVSQSGHYYIFYSPEKLAMLGWIGVILTGLVGFLGIRLFSPGGKQRS